MMNFCRRLIRLHRSDQCCEGSSWSADVQCLSASQSQLLQHYYISDALVNRQGYSCSIGLGCRPMAYAMIFLYASRAVRDWISYANLRGRTRAAL